MATRNQIKFIELNKNLIKESILIVGSKMYDFDKESIQKNLIKWGFKDIQGIDLFEGEGVDCRVDITEIDSEFIKTHQEFFNTIFCMEVLTFVRNPFIAAQNMKNMLKEGGYIILSECYIRKISKIPIDLWRFTYDGTKELFSGLQFNDDRVMMSLVRDKNEQLQPLKYPLPQVLNEKHNNENGLGYLLRRVHRKFFAKGIFKISRLMPEITIYSIAKK